MSSPPPEPRPRLLILSQTLPFPLDSGVKIRAWYTWRELARTFDVTALCFYRRTTTSPEAAAAGLRQIADARAFSIPQEGSRVQFLRDHLRSLGTGRVYTCYAYDSAEYRRALQSQLALGGWGAIQAESLDLSGYFPLIQNTPLICVHHDIQSRLLARRAGVESSWLRRGYLRHQASLMRREERLWAETVALNVVVSEPDRDCLLAAAPAARILVAPNAVDTEAWLPSGEEDTSDDVLFVGGSEWFPNLDGVEWFARAVLPLVRQARPEVRVRWVGRSSPEEQARLSARGVHSTGYVEDPRGLVSRAKCVIVPLRAGGGTRIKLLEAWAAGKPVVSTTIGAEGLEAAPEDNILLADTAEQFAAALLRLLDSPALRRDLGAAGRRTVLRSYQWPAVGELLRAAYLKVAQEAVARGVPAPRRRDQNW